MALTVAVGPGGGEARLKELSLTAVLLEPVPTMSQWVVGLRTHAEVIYASLPEILLLRWLPKGPHLEAFLSELPSC